MLVFGKNVATEVINSKTKIKKVFVTKNFDNKYILDYLRNNNIKIINMDKREMDEKYGKGAHSLQYQVLYRVHLYHIFRPFLFYPY